MEDPPKIMIADVTYRTDNPRVVEKVHHLALSNYIRTHIIYIEEATNQWVIFYRDEQKYDISGMIQVDAHTHRFVDIEILEECTTWQEVVIHANKRLAVIQPMV